jgi:hypothetical protein
MDYRTVIILGAISLVFFVIQLLFCLKAKRVKIKLIPVYVIPLFVIISILDYTRVLGFLDNGSFISVRIIGFFFAVGATTAFIGYVLAWSVWVLYKFFKKNKNL